MKQTLLDLNKSATILQKIVSDKVSWLQQKQQQLPLDEFIHKINLSDRSFYQALEQGTHSKPAYILECKKASPSKGLIRTDFNLAKISQNYKNYAAAISVLTDEKYFQGDFNFIAQVRNNLNQPILCKDFFISEYQIYLARFHQADAILLMLSVLTDDAYLRFANLAHKLGMGVLTEVSTENEFKRAIKLKAKIIGINNRNLHDLSVDLSRTKNLVAQFKDKIDPTQVIISESGIYTHQQIQQLQPLVNGFLIGSSLMSEDNIEQSVRKIIYGENKVCGLTRAEDVTKAYSAGALYAGLIFAPNSKRKLTLAQAQELVSLANLRFVGVFQNQDAKLISSYAKQLNLFAVQLHGNEDETFISQLAQLLGDNVEIWQAISFNTDFPKNQKIGGSNLIKKYVLDSNNGGSGKAFDWNLIPDELKEKSLLAGGISLVNIEAALVQNCLGVDLNSGVESETGLKDSAKLNTIFKIITAYTAIK